MLQILMYHRVGEGKHANSLEMIFEHLSYLCKNYPVLLPGDPLPSKKLSLCLTFDDAYYDFYHFVFPLLKKFNIRALLAVSTAYIIERSQLPFEERLSVPYYEAMKEGVLHKNNPFCTWEELEEMVESGYVEIASHGHRHLDLKQEGVDLGQEILHSKKVIETWLPQKVSTFIYPYGNRTKEAQELVAKHYGYSMRIGSALNWGWGEKSKPLYRIPADNLLDPKAPFSYGKLGKSYLKALLRFLSNT